MDVTNYEVILFYVYIILKSSYYSKIYSSIHLLVEMNALF